MINLQREIIESVVSNPYKEHDFKRLLKELFEGMSFSYSVKIPSPWSEFKDHIDSFSELARYTDSTEKSLAVLVVRLASNSKVEKARSLQRNFVAKFLENENCDAALVAFYSKDQDNWRLSFVSLDYSFDEEGLFKHLTPAKRYSFLLGPLEPNYTIKSQLLPLLKKNSISIHDLEEAFSVDKVTRNFFTEYQEKYVELKSFLDSSESFIAQAQVSRFTSEQFAKKLMGQLAFLYFLQKKGWLGVKLIPDSMTENEFQAIYSNQIGQEQDLLNKLFKRADASTRELVKDMINTLSVEEANLLADCFKGTQFEGRWGSGDERFVRSLFENKAEGQSFYNDYLEPLFYECLNYKRSNTHYFKLLNCKIPFLNGGLFEPIDEYDYKNNRIAIPDELFSYKTKRSDTGTGILDIFDIYNFTINEDEPLEKEVAVDPEMLGKIFENLLDGEDRKDKGAFYTPREIVHYMCQESLINYLGNVTELNKEDIHLFVTYGETLRDNDLALNSEKEGLLLPSSIYENLEKIDQCLAEVKVADPAVGSGAFPLGMLNEIVKIRMNITEYLCRQKNEMEADTLRFARTAYSLKLETMKNSIYAVDIEASAVDITKLRLWLSLIVDENENGIRPLPNLDYNVMCGNSLIDQFEGIELFDEKLLRKKSKPKATKQLDLFSSKDQDFLEVISFQQKQLFSEQDREKKIEIRKKVNDMEWELIYYKLSKEGYQDAYHQLEKYKKERVKPYFLWKLEFNHVFKENGGFDILIGNPPYGAKVDDVSKKVMLRKMKDTKNTNTAAAFIDYAKNQWINPKGIISYIVPKSLLYSERWYSLVESMNKKTSVLVDVEKAFEKVKLEQVVFVYNEDQTNKTYKAQKFIDKKMIREAEIPVKLVSKFRAWICDVTQDEIDIINNIRVPVVQMKEISSTKRGIGVQKFLSDSGEVPVIGGKNIFHYGCDGVKGYIKQEEFEKNQVKLNFMRNPKIISQDLIAHVQNPRPHILLTSYYDATGEIVGLDTVQNTILNDSNYDYKYILALMNSKFISWYTYKFIYCSAVRTMHFDKNYLGRILIPQISREAQKPIIDLVDEISNLTSQPFFRSDQEQVQKFRGLIRKMDSYVYDLFKLNEAERMVVEKS